MLIILFFCTKGQWHQSYMPFSVIRTNNSYLPGSGSGLQETWRRIPGIPCILVSDISMLLGGSKLTGSRQTIDDVIVYVMAYVIVYVGYYIATLNAYCGVIVRRNDSRKHSSICMHMTRK